MKNAFNGGSRRRTFVGEEDKEETIKGIETSILLIAGGCYSLMQVLQGGEH